MKIAELRQKSKEELQSLLEERMARMDELRFLLRQKKIKNVREIAHVRKDIARILTVSKTPLITN